MSQLKKVIDLSHTLLPGMPVFPGDAFPDFRAVSSVEKNGHKETLVSMTTHTGTHLDTPAHVIHKGKTISDLETERFFGKGYMLDCSDIKAGKNIDAELLQKHVSSIRKADFVLFFTGWSRYWGKSEYFSNFPVLSNNAAEYLSQYNLKGIGMDTPSVDPVDDDNLKIHHILLQQNIIIIENLTNLVALAGEDFYFCCFPLKIENGDGSPVRATAILL